MTRKDGRDSERQSRRLDRRKLLKALGVAGVSTTLAGCNSGGGDSTTDAPTDDGGSDGGSDGGDGNTDGGTATPTAEPTPLPNVDTTYNGMTLTTTEDAAFNVDHWARKLGDMQPLVQEKFWYPYQERPGILESVEPVDETEVRLHLTDSYWNNGEPVTGEDVAIWWRIHQLMFGPGRQTLEEQGTDSWLYAFEDQEWDESTLYMLSPSGYFEGMADFALKGSFKYSNYNLAYNRFQHKAAVESLEETAAEAAPDGDPRHEDAKQAITDWWWNKHLNMDSEWNVPWSEAITNGPFQIDEVNEGEWVMSKNPHHRNADLINWEEAVFEYRENENAQWAAMQGGHVDGITNLETPQHVYDQFSGDYKQSLTPFKDGTSLRMHHGAKYLDDWRVRQAIAYVLDREQIARTEHQNASEALTVPAGISNQALENLNLDGFSRYESNSDNLSKAAQLLRDAGFSRDGQTWMTPDGEKYTLSLLTNENTPEVELTILTQLEQFGIGGELTTVEDAVYTERAHNYPIEYELSIGYWSQYGAAIENPADVFYDALRWRGYYENQTDMWPREQVADAVNNGSLEWVEPDEEGQDPQRVQTFTADEVEDFTIQAPPVGEWDGDLQEWSVISLQMNQEADTEEKVRQNQRELAWLRAFNVPDIPLTQTLTQGFQKRDGWVIPSDDSDAWVEQPYDMVALGQIQADPNA